MCQVGCDQISSTTPITIITIPTPSRGLVFCPKMKAEIACANSTSTSASVRTLAAVASAKARNQNCDAVAPMKPANSDGRHCATMADSTGRSRSASGGALTEELAAFLGRYGIRLPRDPVATPDE